ncbi:MAG TPA: DUF4173 domain-containing protein [Conexibacter sp.]|nr:DUF4173 domain-containing protein [Conexibacter sp.]
MSRPALACAIGSGALAASAVAQQRVGLALALALVLAIAAGTLGSPRRASRGLIALALALTVQPLLLDAGWVVAVDVCAALVAAAAAVGALDEWPRVGHALLAPLRLVGGTALVGRALHALWPAIPQGHVRPIVRGLGCAAVLTFAFGGLFVTADSAFAELLGRTFSFRLDTGQLVWRLALGVAFVGIAGAVARNGMQREASVDPGPRWVPGRVELTIALSAVVVLFAAFVAVQVRVLFGGAGYVQATTGLGYGDYARQGFVELLLVAGLALAVIAVAARRADRSVRGLLAALCILTFVVLWSAHHRLDLVEDAYGFTRVRYAGHAVVAWLAALFGLVLAAGCHPAIGRRVPRIATTMTLAGVLAFSLSNPDARIAQRAVDRAAAGGPLDSGYLAGLSADALPALEHLPPPERTAVLPALRARLARTDGIAGLNLSRARAR